MSPRMTRATRAVLAELLRNPTTEKYSLEICEAVLLASGTVHPILTRLEAAGWLTSRYEDIDPRKAERPARRYFRLTPDGVDLARAALGRPPRLKRTTGPVEVDATTNRVLRRKGTP